MVRDRHQKPHAMSLGGGATTPNTTPPPTHGQFLDGSLSNTNLCSKRQRSVERG